MSLRRGSVAALLGRLGNLALDLLYPPRCPLCDRPPLPWGEPVCPACLCALAYVEPPYCLRCGRSIQDEEAALCRDCAGREGESPFVRGRVLYRYEQLAPSIYRFKYKGRREYARFFGREMATHFGDFLERAGAQALCPIPLHKKRQHRRGYNQAELLAREAGAALGLPVYGDLLLRCKNTRPLKELGMAQRQINLKNAFIIGRNDVKLDTIVLVDDIYTTGATLESAAKSLLEGGAAERVYFIALAGKGDLPS